MNHEHDDAIEALLRTAFDGPVRDDGFSARVMQRLPPRRRRVAWPSLAGVLAGAAACWLTLLFSPLLQAGWRDWIGGDFSQSAIALLLATAGLSLMTAWWSIAEADDR